MKNIWKIFTGDLKKLVKQPFALVIIIGLCVIPSLYAWFNIFANWDPCLLYTSTKAASPNHIAVLQLPPYFAVSKKPPIIKQIVTAPMYHSRSPFHAILP